MEREEMELQVVEQQAEQQTEQGVEQSPEREIRRTSGLPTDKAILKRLGYIESKIDDEVKSSKEVISRLNYTENKTDEQTRILKEILNRLNYIETKVDRMMGNTRRPYTEEKKDYSVEAKKESSVFEESKDSE